MEDLGGWIWALVGLGVIVLGLGIAYGNDMWRHRRKDYAAKHEQAEVTRENYRRGG
ncbi:MAG: hypothetical protein ACRECX_03440 [Methyloceanibacter sp.]|uniref:hypothetical protein n=1 Tax=Methyloceanibacter sp. TaxID=1965321 RepID=UPI003D6CD81B